MAKVNLGDWGTYYVGSGTSTPNLYGDVMGRFQLQYESEPSNLRYKITVLCYVRQKPDLSEYPYLVDSVNGTIGVSINGSDEQSSSINLGSYHVNDEAVVKRNVSTKTFYISVDNEGNASCKLKGKITIDGVTKTCAHTWNLPTMNVASSITDNTSSSNPIEFGKDVKFTITAPNSSIKNTLSYSINGTSYSIGTLTGSGTKTYLFSTSLISKFPSNEIVSIKVYATSSNGTSDYTTVYLKVPNSYVPTISKLVLEDAMPNKPSVLNDLWIKNKSILKGTITASGISGSSIKSYTSKLSDFSTIYNTNPFTTKPLTISGTRTITSYVTDTRGRKSVDKTQEIIVVDYFTPAFKNTNVKRCNEDGTINESGNYAKVSCEYKISPINNLNTKSLTIAMGTGQPQSIELTDYEGTIEIVLFNGLEQSSTYEFSFNLTDIFGTTKQVFILGVAKKALSLYYDKVNKEYGVAMGEKATKTGFVCNLITNFKKSVLINNNPIIESGSNDNGEYVKFYDGTMICRKTCTGSADINKSWGTMYDTGDGTGELISLGDYPKPFVGKRPQMLPLFAGANSCFVASIRHQSNSFVGHIILASPRSKSVNYTIDIIAIGRWKQ